MMTLILVIIVIGLDKYNYTVNISEGIFELFHYTVSYNGIIVLAICIGLILDIGKFLLQYVFRALKQL